MEDCERASGLSLLCFAILFIFQKLTSYNTHTCYISRKEYTKIMLFLGKKNTYCYAPVDFTVLNCNFVAVKQLEHLKPNPNQT